jgi:hypothetical protein
MPDFLIFSHTFSTFWATPSSTSTFGAPWAPATTATSLFSGTWATLTSKIATTQCRFAWTTSPHSSTPIMCSSLAAPTAVSSSLTSPGSTRTPSGLAQYKDSRIHACVNYPCFVRAVTALNPVTNLASMAGVSDIPDWCFNEAGYAFENMPPSEKLNPQVGRMPFCMSGFFHSRSRSTQEMLRNESHCSCKKCESAHHAAHWQKGPQGAA